MDLGLFEPLAIALGLGLLVGLQREWKESEVAGIRTFPLITLFGAVTGIVDGDSIGWFTAAGLFAVSVLLYTANQAKLHGDQVEPGMTTEAAALLMYGVGTMLAAGHTAESVVVAGAAAVLLHWKPQLHALVRQIGENDFRGIIHLVLIALVILPLLPDETFGPYDVLNPYRIWLMVVLIVGISLAAYVIYKLLGARVGSVLAGVLGGLISSTATSVSYARQTKGSDTGHLLAALVIMIASTIVNARVLFEIGVVAPQLLRVALLPLSVLMGWMLLLSLLLLVPARREGTPPPQHENPSQLKAAIVFGALYAVVLFLVAAVKDQFGSQALYVVAIISGMTDMDAITLSTAKLVNDERVSAETAWRVILVATMSNLAFKAGAVAMLGSRRLLVYIFVLFGLSLAAGGLLLAFWPDVELAVPTEWFGGGEAQTDDGGGGTPQ